MNLNVVVITGNLGKKPERSETHSGQAVTNMSVACSENRRGADGKKYSRTDWIPVVAYGKLAEACCEHLDKGRLISVTGKLRSRTYEKDGQKRRVLELVAEEVNFGPRPSKPNDSGEDTESGSSAEFVPPPEE